MKNIFPILGIETSGELCSVALMLNETTFYEFNILEKHIHSKKLLEMIDNLLKSAEIELKDISQIAVSIGPGSFTGLRIGLTAAKGLGLGGNIPLTPIQTFNAMALQISEYLQKDSRFIILRNASIEDLYFAEYLYDGNVCSPLSEVFLLKKDELNKKLVWGNLIFSDLESNNGVKKIVSPGAAHICKYAYLFGQDLLTFDYDYLEPFYLKQFIARVKK
ncbi:MAG: tRNA (adenosine(37)-N6)-threonylcarbamoyltransferase complex dimerization subunit type 1 TsaB [Melioribacteraceae bacterium]|nr:tRNA (adenosine(37)-N6)-threonylcarbamoyltransferase complex dimerization subunit type 1 TsaB [Melioribacteraceae bacterium]